MEWWQAVILGLVEGLTEYLPVSSTGHLILAQRLMGIEQDTAADAYAICIQAGAILAVVGLYRQRLIQMLGGLLWQRTDGLKMLINVIVAVLPAVVIGLLLNSRIKEHLFGIWPIITAWIVGGLAILVVTRLKGRGQREKGRPGFDLEHLPWKLALIIGMAQCIAMWPGVSRSLVTIVAGLIVGMRLTAAVEFSFLLGLLTLTGATFYDGYNHGQVMIDTYGISPLLIGFLFAFLSAIVAIKWMVAYLQRHSLQIFGWYRVALGAIVAGLIVAGFFEP